MWKPLSVTAAVAIAACGAACTCASSEPAGTPVVTSRTKTLAGAEALVLDLAENLVRDKTEILNTAVDWDEIESNIRGRKELQREMTSDQMRTELANGLYYMFRPGPGADMSHIRFATRAVAPAADYARVFLFDGKPDAPGTINLTFILKWLDDRWKVVYVDFYPYGRWAFTSNSKARQEYRKTMMRDYQ